MAAIDELNTRIEALTQNQTDTAAAVAAVVTGIAGLKAEIQQLRDQLAASEGGLTADELATVLAGLDSLVATTQANEDALAAAVA